FGSIHRNAYINSPRALTAHLSAKDDPRLLFAGQLTGVEGYTESAATGILAGINLARLLAGDDPLVPPPTTMLGALYRYVHTADPEHFQPMHGNSGLLDPVDRLAVRGWLGAMQQRGLAKRSAARALSAVRTFYRFLDATRGLEVNPAKAARTPKPERTLPTHLDRFEIDLLFAEAERRADAG